MGRVKLRLAIAAALGCAALSTAGIAAQPSPLAAPPPSGTGLPNGQCILSRDVRNHTIADDHTLLFDVNGQVYRMTVSNNCLAAAVDSDPLLIRNQGSIYICKPIDLDVSVGKGGADSRCIVDSIVRMTPEQAAALPKRLRP